MISTEWIKHLTDPQRKQDFEAILRNNQLLFSRLRDILTEWEADILSAERSKKQYDVPNWSQLQAHRNGNLETIQRLKDLISFTGKGRS